MYVHLHLYNMKALLNYKWNMMLKMSVGYHNQCCVYIYILQASAVWLKYCRYGIEHYAINQSYFIWLTHYCLAFILVCLVRNCDRLFIMSRSDSWTTCYATIFVFFIYLILEDIKQLKDVIFFCYYLKYYWQITYRKHHHLCGNDD